VIDDERVISRKKQLCVESDTMGPCRIDCWSVDDMVIGCRYRYDMSRGSSAIGSIRFHQVKILSPCLPCSSLVVVSRIIPTLSSQHCLPSSNHGLNWCSP
jgi:hypothetical protein